MNICKRANISIPFAKQRPSKSFDSCASFMTAIVAVNFDWPIESCDKAPCDLNYERNTEKYGRAMKLTITFYFWKLQYGLFCHTTSQLKKLVERNK